MIGTAKISDTKNFFLEISVMMMTVVTVMSSVMFMIVVIVMMMAVMFVMMFRHVHPSFLFIKTEAA